MLLQTAQGVYTVPVGPQLELLEHPATRTRYLDQLTVSVQFVVGGEFPRGNSVFYQLLSRSQHCCRCTCVDKVTNECDSHTARVVSISVCSNMIPTLAFQHQAVSTHQEVVSENMLGVKLRHWQNFILAQFLKENTEQSNQKQYKICVMF